MAIERNPRRRRITLADLLILIVAVAVGLALARTTIEGLRSQAPSRSGTARIKMYYIRGGQDLSACFLVPLGAALLVIGRRGPGSTCRRFAREPGRLACLVATAGCAHYAALSSAQVAMGRLPLTPANVDRIMFAFAADAAQWVAGAWLALALGRRWRPERDWVGRCGRALGVAWIVVYATRWVGAFL